MISHIRNLVQHHFVRKAALLQFGNALGTMVQAVAGIILARILQPEQFGVYSLAFSLASVTSVFLGTGIQDAVTPHISRAWVRNDKHELHRVFGFWLRMILTTGIFTLLVSMTLPYLGDQLYENRAVGWYAEIIVTGSVISTLAFSFSALALQVAGHLTGYMALTLSDQVTRYVFSMALALFGFGVLGAVAGHFFGALCIAVLSLGMWTWVHHRHPILPSLKELVACARRASLKELFVPSVWVSLDRNIAMLYMALPVAITGLYVVITEVTYFKLAFGYINLALSLLGPISVLLNVEFPKMQIEDAGKLRRQFIRVSLYGLGLSMLLTMGAIAVSPVAFKLLYGESFMPSVPYVAGLLVYGGLFGIGVGLGPMWRAIDKVKVSILINLVTLSIGIPVGILLLKSFQTWGAVAMVTLWYTASHLVSFFYLGRKLKAIEARTVSV